MILCPEYGLPPSQNERSCKPIYSSGEGDQVHQESSFVQIHSGDLDSSGLRDLIASSTGALCFNSIDFSGMDLSRADLRGARFERCVLIGTCFTAARLEATQWRNCRAAQVQFSSASLNESTFSGCDLNNSQWQRSKVAHVRFDGCKLTGANFADASSLGLVFHDCVLRCSCLSGISFYKSELYNLDFAEADLSDCDFRKAVLVNGGRLSMAQVNGARFDQADLREASLAGLRLVDAKLFKGAVISRAQDSMLLAGLGLSVL